MCIAAIPISIWPKMVFPSVSCTQQRDQFNVFCSVCCFRRYIETFSVLLLLSLGALAHFTSFCLFLFLSFPLPLTVLHLNTQLIDLYLTQKLGTKRQTNFSQLLLLNAYKLKNKEVK